MRVIHAAAAALLLTPALVGVAAQAQTPLAAGTHVRVTSTLLDPQQQTATVLGQHGDTLLLRADGHGATLALPYSAVQSFELDAGRHSHALRGMKYGFIAGVAIGAVSGALSYSECTAGECWFHPTRAGSALLGAIGGGLLGPLVGAGAGAIWRTHDWTPVVISGSPVALHVAPTGAGMTASASIAF